MRLINESGAIKGDPAARQSNLRTSVALRIPRLVDNECVGLRPASFFLTLN